MMIFPIYGKIKNDPNHQPAVIGFRPQVVVVQVEPKMTLAIPWDTGDLVVTINENIWKL